MALPVCVSLPVCLTDAVHKEEERRKADRLAKEAEAARLDAARLLEEAEAATFDAVSSRTGHICVTLSLVYHVLYL